MASVDGTIGASQPLKPAQDGENQENKDPSQEEEGSLRKMFVDGANAIATHRPVAELGWTRAYWSQRTGLCRAPDFSENWPEQCQGNAAYAGAFLQV